MKKDKQEKLMVGLSLPGTSASDLRGKQSVRATFKLTEKAIVALSIVSVHLGIKQKSLFDHLMEDGDALAAIAHNIEDREFNRREGVQKTYVLSRRTLSSLERASKHYNAPRDALVEYSIQRLLPVIAKEKQRHEKRKQILSDLREYLNQGLRLLEESTDLLGESDPVYDQVTAAVKGVAAACENIDHFVERGKIIEDF